jgi:hypothetical protein
MKGAFTSLAQGVMLFCATCVASYMDCPDTVSQKSDDDAYNSLRQTVPLDI